MTEKRFGMYQNILYDDGSILNPFNAMKLLNYFEKENTKLKEENEQFHNIANDYNISFDKLCETFEQCLNENEELKQRNEFLKKQLDRVCFENELMGDKLKKIGRIL